MQGPMTSTCLAAPPQGPRPLHRSSVPHEPRAFLSLRGRQPTPVPLPGPGRLFPSGQQRKPPTRDTKEGCRTEGARGPLGGLPPA